MSDDDLAIIENHCLCPMCQWRFYDCLMRWYDRKSDSDLYDGERRWELGEAAWETQRMRDAIKRDAVRNGTWKEAA